MTATVEGYATEQRGRRLTKTVITALLAISLATSAAFAVREHNGRAADRKEMTDLHRQINVLEASNRDLQTRVNSATTVATTRRPTLADSEPSIIEGILMKHACEQDYNVVNCHWSSNEKKYIPG